MENNLIYKLMENLANKRQLTIIYSRVVGWITPIMNFNPGKSSEYKDRVVYTGEIKD